jgi:MFS family permease
MFAIQTDLNTSPTHVAATLAAPMFTLGLSALVWGPACDAFGRQPTFLLAASALLGLSIGSALSPSIAGERPPAAVGAAAP